MYHVGVTITRYRSAVALTSVYIPPRESSETRQAVISELPAIYVNNLHRDLIAAEAYNPITEGLMGQVFKITIDLNFAIPIDYDEAEAIKADWKRLEDERLAYKAKRIQEVVAARIASDARKAELRYNRWWRKLYRWALQ